MKTLTKKQWEIVRIEKLASLIKENNPEKNIFNDIIPAIFEFQRYERQLQRLAELSCNGYPKPTIEYRDGKMYRYDVEDVALRERSEKRESKIESKVKDLAASFNLTVNFQGDPRGLMFSLKTAAGVDLSL